MCHSNLNPQTMKKNLILITCLLSAGLLHAQSGVRAVTQKISDSTLTGSIKSGANTLEVSATGTLKFNSGFTLTGGNDLKSALSLNAVENTALSTWTGTTNITSLGTVTTGVWNGTAVAVANGGTGSTTANAARTALGLAIGSDVQAYHARLTAFSNLANSAGVLTNNGSGTLSYTAKGAALNTADNANKLALHGTGGELYASGQGLIVENGFVGSDQIQISPSIIQFFQVDGSRVSSLQTGGALTGNRTWTLPDATGTIALTTSNISGTAAGLSATLAVGSGGTGLTAPGTSGNVLTSNGSAWVSSAPVSAFDPASPGAIGGTTPAAGTFTTLTAGSTTSLLLGTAGSAVGNIGFRNATSGTATLAPPTGALGTYTITLPSVASTLSTLGANTYAALQTITQASVDTGIIASTGYSLTGSNATNMIDLAGTWNTSGAPSGIKLNITNTASGSASRLLNLQAGGTSVFTVGPEGRIYGAAEPGFPQFTEIGYPGNGMRVYSDRLDFWLSSAVIFTVSSAGLDFGGSAMSWGNNAQLRGGSDGTGRLVQRVSTTPQAYSVANTYTSFTNKEEVELGWTGSVAHLWTIKGSGGGTARDLVLGYDSTEKARISSAGFTIGSGGAAISKTLTGTASLDYDLTALITEDKTITVTGAALGDVVLLGVPNGSVTTTAQFSAWVSATNTVTVRCRTAAIGENPASGTFRATIIQH